MKGMHILVVDDERRIREMVREYFSAEGASVDEANDGCEALDKLEKSERPYDAIILDIMMPRLDGYQTCALIKKNAKYKSTPVIMLSSKDGLFDRARGRMVGSDQYLTKPFTKESLLKAVAAHVNRAAA